MNDGERTRAFSLCSFGFHDLPPLEAIGPEDHNDPYGAGKRWPPMFVGRGCLRCGERRIDCNPWYRVPGDGSRRARVNWREERRYAITVIKITLACCAIILAVGLVLTATLT